MVFRWNADGKVLQATDQAATECAYSRPGLYILLFNYTQPEVSIFAFDDLHCKTFTFLLQLMHGFILSIWSIEQDGSKLLL